jgi:flagellar basal-body rod protein FlgC
MMFEGLDVALSGMKVQRMRMDLVSSNLANVNSTRGGPDGGPYRKKVPVFEAVLDQKMTSGAEARGVHLSKVAIKEIVEDSAPLKMKYDPKHPDADSNGYVRLPNIDPMRETVDMMSAIRSYEANLTAFNTHKEMLLKSLEILRV